MLTTALSLLAATDCDQMLLLVSLLAADWSELNRLVSLPKLETWVCNCEAWVFICSSGRPSRATSWLTMELISRPLPIPSEVIAGMHDSCGRALERPTKEQGVQVATRSA